MPSSRLGGGGGGGLTLGSAIVSADTGAEIAAWYAAERAFERLTEPVDFLGREDSSLRLFIRIFRLLTLARCP